MRHALRIDRHPGSPQLAIPIYLTREAAAATRTFRALVPTWPGILGTVGDLRPSVMSVIGEYTHDPSIHRRPIRRYDRHADQVVHSAHIEAGP